MGKLKKFVTSAGGSCFLSVAIHVGLVLGVVAYIQLSIMNREPAVDETYVDLNYDLLEAPPAPTEEPARIRSAPIEEKVVEKTEQKIEDAPRELQDAQGEVAGTQEKTTQAAALGAEGSGSAATTPYYKIKPKFPRKALAAGIEGWVMLKIDIAKDGSVNNVRVIDGENRDEFQMEARRAVAQWKYRPFLDDGGQPTDKSDHQVRVDFNLKNL